MRVQLVSPIWTCWIRSLQVVSLLAVLSVGFSAGHPVISGGSGSGSGSETSNAVGTLRRAVPLDDDQESSGLVHVQLRAALDSIQGRLNSW